MINDETKTQFLQELEKSGSVYVSCRKVNIARMTYYRWFKSDSAFRKHAQLAVKLGRADLVDAALHGLKKKALEGDMTAIKHVLAHNDPRYKPQKPPAQVVITHLSPDKVKQMVQQKTIEDLLDEEKRRSELEESKRAEDSTIPPIQGSGG